MDRKPKYDIVEETDEYVLIRDVGPWDEHLSVTFGAEYVVEELATRLAGRRLEYYDVGGERDQLLVKDGKFDGFAECPKPPEKHGPDNRSVIEIMDAAIDSMQDGVDVIQKAISKAEFSKPKTPIVSVLYNQGWRIVLCSCECGGRFAWLYPDGKMYGCICHNYPEEETPA